MYRGIPTPHSCSSITLRIPFSSASPGTPHQPRRSLSHGQSRSNAEGGKVLVPAAVVPPTEAAPVSHSGARAGSPTEKPPRPGAENRLLQLLRDLRCSADRCRAWAPAGSSPGHVGREGCGGRTGCPSPAARLAGGCWAAVAWGTPQRRDRVLGGRASCCRAAEPPCPLGQGGGAAVPGALGRVTPQCRQQRALGPERGARQEKHRTGGCEIKRPGVLSHACHGLLSCGPAPLPPSPSRAGNREPGQACPGLARRSARSPRAIGPAQPRGCRRGTGGLQPPLLEMPCTALAKSCVPSQPH